MRLNSNVVNSGAGREHIVTRDAKKTSNTRRAS